jgi:hypothetical protein
MYELHFKGRDGSKTSIEGQDALQLLWLLRGSETQIDLPYGINQFVDLCFTTRGEPNVLTPCFAIFPFRLASYCQKPGVFSMGVVVTADNAEPARVTARFRWNGSWDQLSTNG